MKLSIEAKVAAAVATAFAALTVATIAQGNSSNRTGGPDTYTPADNPGMSNNMTEQASNSSLPARTNAEETRHRLSSYQHETVSAERGKNIKISRPLKQHTQHTDQNRRTEIKESAG